MTPLKADACCKRGWFFSWGRPAMIWMIVAAIPVAVWKGHLSDTAFFSLLGFGFLLYAWRGAIDKDGLARLLKIWKTNS